MITLAHISDAHLAPLPPVRPRDLLNKRITGFINWRLKRSRTLDGEGLNNLVRHMREQRPDLIAITGDLMNLSLEAEINTAYNWLQTVGEPEAVVVSPGNHDAYVPGQLERALERWNGYVLGETVDDNQFPFVRRIGEVAVVVCNSAVPTLPWMASGRFDREQEARLARCLRLLGEAGYFRVVMIHHPPNQEAASHPRLGLHGARNFRRAVAEAGAELVLHGHTHKSSIYAIPGRTPTSRWSVSLPPERRRAIPAAMIRRATTCFGSSAWAAPGSARCASSASSGLTAISCSG